MMTTRPTPDPAALAAARSLLRTPLTLQQLLDNPAHRVVLFNVARRHMQRRARVDVKKLQANDNE